MAALTPAPTAARAKLAARRARTRRLRLWVVAAMVWMFIACFALIYVRMARGEDPALGRATTTPARQASTQSGSTTARQQAALARHRSEVRAARRKRARDRQATQQQAAATTSTTTSGAGDVAPSSAAPAPVTTSQS